MALLPTVGKNAPKRRPTLKGNVMIDVSHGDERARAWPRGRGKPKTAEEKRRQDKFAAANLATKYIAPQIAVDFTDAVKGTPLLPRDLLISQMYDRLASFILADGKERFPMVARTDVSEALDALANQPGQILQRGNEWWEGRQLGPGTVAPYQTIVDQTLPSPASVIDVNNLAGYTDIMVFADSLTKSVSGQHLIRLSVDNGSTFYSAATDYSQLQADGTVAAASGLSMHATNATAARTALAQITKYPSPVYPQLYSVNRAFAVYFKASPLEVNAIRLQPSAGGNFTGGRIIVCAR